MSDLIDRQEAIDEFEKELSAKYNRRELAIGFVGIKSILENLPSAQPERKKGKWINARFPFLKCSNCEYYFDAITNFGNFCPKCGADMRGEENETD